MAGRVGVIMFIVGCQLLGRLVTRNKSLEHVSGKREPGYLTGLVSRSSQPVFSASLAPGLVLPAMIGIVLDDALLDQPAADLGYVVLARPQGIGISVD